MKKIEVICGPTSTGKTSLAIKLCKQNNGIIISADSRQIYKHMDIGTGKIPVNTNYDVKKGDGYWIFDGIMIYGYDIVLPNQHFTAYDYIVYGRNLINKFMNSEFQIYIVGGTGFYIDALLGRKKLSNVPPNYELREKLKSKSLEELKSLTTSLILDNYKIADYNNKARLIRAIEVNFGNNKKSEVPDLSNKIEVKYTGLTSNREILYSRADRWLESIWNDQLFNEVRYLIDNNLTAKLNSIIYKDVKTLLSGDISQEEAKQKAKYSLHNYIRRQLTYFKKNKEISWVNI